MNHFGRNLALASAVTLLGLTMLMWTFEAGAVDERLARAAGVSADSGIGTYATAFVGVTLLNLGVIWLLTMLSRYFRENPSVRGLPRWMLWTFVAVGSIALAFSSLWHLAYVSRLEEVPTSPSQGFVAFTVVASGFALAGLILLGARWSPGLRRRLSES